MSQVQLTPCGQLLSAKWPARVVALGENDGAREG